MTTYTVTSVRTAQSPATRRLSLVQRLLDLLALHRQRRALDRLDPHLLEDIGLSREAAAAEAQRKFWDAPEYWLR